MTAAFDLIFELIFGSVYHGLGRILWGKEFGTAKNPIPRWKLVILGIASCLAGFGILISLLWAGSLAFNSFHKH
jgi:hypothetical protein